MGRDNIPPPTAPEIQLAAIDAPALARDNYGNAQGGIRLPQHAIPTAANTGTNSGPGFCRLYGSFQPFDDKTLRVRYPDRKAYVLQVVQVALDDVASGFRVSADAMETIRSAFRSGVGKHGSRRRP